MLIIPAIDLKDKKVVRFVQGKDHKKIYSEDPVGVALNWQNQGALLIHIVDLDGAFSGRPKNISILKRILKNIEVPVEFGGGIRTFSLIKKILDLGVFRVVLGTKAIQDKKFISTAYKKFKDKIIVSLDISKNRIMLKGWREKSSYDIFYIIKQLKDIGFKKIIYTDIQRDGTLIGPNIINIKNFLKKANIETIVSGGISTLSDIQKLKKLEIYGLCGIIVGKALYEKKFSLKEAIEILRERR